MEHSLCPLADRVADRQNRDERAEHQDHHNDDDGEIDAIGEHARRRSRDRKLQTHALGREEAMNRSIGIARDATHCRILGGNSGDRGDRRRSRCSRAPSKRASILPSAPVGACPSRRCATSRTCIGSNSAQLAILRSRGTDPEALRYLNALCVRAYTHLQVTPPRREARVGDFYFARFPATLAATAWLQGMLAVDPARRCAHRRDAGSARPRQHLCRDTIGDVSGR